MKKHRKAKQFLEELRNTPVVSAVCKQMGLSRQTIFRWLKEDPEFNKEYEECMTQGIENVNDLAFSQAINKIKQGDPGMTKYWLSNNHKLFMKKQPSNLPDTTNLFNHDQERRIDFLDVGESMLMKRVLDGDLNAIRFALQYNSGRYHPMKPESPRLDMTDLSDPVVKSIIQAQLDFVSERLQQMNLEIPDDEITDEDQNMIQ